MPATIFSANRSTVLVNSQQVEGLQEITFQTSRPYQDVAAIGAPERVGVVFGPTAVTGTLRVRSVNQGLEKLLTDQTPFQIMAALSEKGGEEQKVPVTLTDVVLHGKSVGLAAGGVLETTYNFSATRAAIGNGE